MKRTTLIAAQSDYRRFIEDLKARVSAAPISAAREHPMGAPYRVAQEDQIPHGAAKQHWEDIGQ